jgi:hypothetical protein
LTPAPDSLFSRDAKTRGVTVAQMILVHFVGVRIPAGLRSSGRGNAPKKNPGEPGFLRGL